MSSFVDDLDQAALSMAIFEFFRVGNRCSGTAPIPVLDAGPVAADWLEIGVMIERVGECCCYEATHVMCWARILSTFVHDLVPAALSRVSSESFRVGNRCSEDGSYSDCHYYLQTSAYQRCSADNSPNHERYALTKMKICHRSSPLQATFAASCHENDSHPHHSCCRSAADEHASDSAETALPTFFDGRTIC